MTKADEVVPLADLNGWMFEEKDGPDLDRPESERGYAPVDRVYTFRREQDCVVFPVAVTKPLGGGEQLRFVRGSQRDGTAAYDGITRDPRRVSVATIVESLSAPPSPVSGLAAGTKSSVEQVASDTKIPLTDFKPKDDSDYLAHLEGREILKTRRHETIVNKYGEWARGQGFETSTPHPRDLVLSRNGKQCSSRRRCSCEGTPRTRREQRVDNSTATGTSSTVEEA